MTSSLDTVSAQTALVGGASIPVAVRSTPATSPQAGSPQADKKGDFTFHDLLETVNPLQHLPLVGPIYRALTGDSISPAARIAGDTLYGGVFGLAGSVVDSLVEGETGKDIGSHIIATLFGSDADESTAAPATASVDTNAAAATSSGSASPATSPTASTTPSPVAAPPASGTTPSAPNDAAAATQPTVSGPKPPSDFFMAQQKGMHASHGVALTTTVPTGDSHRADQKSMNARKVDDALSAAAKAANATTAAPAPSTTSPPSSAPNLTPPTSLLPSAPAASVAPGTPVAQASIPDLMMKALDQYKSLDRQRAQPAQALPANLIN